MKNLKKISVSILLILSISLYWGQDIVDFFKYITKIENASNFQDSQGLISSESSFEEEIPSIIPKNSIEIRNQGYLRFTCLTHTFPSKVYYSIWLPPEIS